MRDRGQLLLLLTSLGVGASFGCGPGLFANDGGEGPTGEDEAGDASGDEATPSDLPPDVPGVAKCPTGPVVPVDCGDDCLAWGTSLEWELELAGGSPEGLHANSEGELAYLDGHSQVSRISAGGELLWTVGFDPHPDEGGVAVTSEGGVRVALIDWVNTVPGYFTWAYSPTGDVLAASEESVIEPQVMALVDDLHIVVGGTIEECGLLQLRELDAAVVWSREFEPSVGESARIFQLAAHAGRIYALLTENNPRVARLLAFDGEGELLWQDEYAEAEGRAQGIAAGPCGPVAALGVHSEFFLAALDPEGQRLWQAPISYGGENIHYRSLTIAGSGEVVSSGILIWDQYDVSGVWTRLSPAGERQREHHLEQLDDREIPERVAAGGQALYSVIALDDEQSPTSHFIRREVLP